MKLLDLFDGALCWIIVWTSSRDCYMLQAQSSNQYECGTSQSSHQHVAMEVLFLSSY
jgi:hypothetical protein